MRFVDLPHAIDTAAHETSVGVMVAALTPPTRQSRKLHPDARLLITSPNPPRVLDDHNDPPDDEDDDDLYDDGEDDDDLNELQHIGTLPILSALVQTFFLLL